jgi:hypothetical protein
MKTFNNWLVIPTALAMLSISAGAAHPQTTQIAPGFRPDPLVITGTSGGGQNKGCGMTGATPNHQFSLSANFNYLRFTVQSTGQPTLLIEGPTGSSCVQADSFSQGTIQAPGYWEKGTYRVYIGDRTGAQKAYTLSITQKR